MNPLRLVPTLLCVLTTSVWAGTDIDTRKPGAEVVSILQDYYAEKYPAYAALRDMRDRKDVNPIKDAQKISGLHQRSPVSEIINSFPSRPFLTIVERAESPKGKKSVVSLDLYTKDDGTCRVVFTTKTPKKPGKLTFAKANPITVEEARKLLK